jgi:glucose-6-phosphate 1-dehydrogenase
MTQWTIILIGATGDLATKRLLPAVYNLVASSKKPIPIELTAIGRENSNPAELFAQAEPYIKSCKEEVLQQLIDATIYHQGDIVTDDFSAFFSSLPLSSHRLVYCSTPSSVFVSIAQKMHQYGVLEKGNTNHCIVFEKPFGKDHDDAQRMDQALSSLLHEDQIYRVDHYLSKELVSSLTILRKSNVFFEPIWSNKYIERIEIVAYEIEILDHRAAFYDKTGALADMMQNHVLQLMTLIGMEIPDDIDTNIKSLRAAKIDFLSNIKIKDTLLGQYEGYTTHQAINPHSTTETFAALEVEVENERWKSVPWFLATGKALAEKRSEIIIKFRPAACPFVGTCSTNYLRIYLNPLEGFTLQINMKKPHESKVIEPVSVQFCYSCLYETESPEAYEILLREIIAGDHYIAVSSQEIELQWSIIDQAKQLNKNLIRYAQGLKNPAERFIKEL